MTKEELRLLIAAGTAEYSKPVYTYAESFDQEKRLKDRMRQAQGLVIPKNLAQEEWEKYLGEVENGTYEPGEPQERYLNDWADL